MSTNKSINLSIKSEKHAGGVSFRHIHVGDPEGDVLLVTPGYGGSRKLFGKNYASKLLKHCKENNKPAPHIVYAHYSSHKVGFDPSIEEVTESFANALTKSKILSELLTPGKGLYVNPHSLGGFIALGAAELNPRIAAKIRRVDGFGVPYNGIEMDNIYTRHAKQLRALQPGSAFIKKFHESQKRLYPNGKMPFDLCCYAADNDNIVSQESAHAHPFPTEQKTVSSPTVKSLDGGHRTQVEDGDTALAVAQAMWNSTSERHVQRLEGASKAAWEEFIENKETKLLHNVLAYGQEIRELDPVRASSPEHLLRINGAAKEFKEAYLKGKKSDVHDARDASSADALLSHGSSVVDQKKNEEHLHGALACYKELRTLDPERASIYAEKECNLQKQHTGIIYKGSGRNHIEIERLPSPLGDKGPNFLHLHGYGDGHFACGYADGKPVSIAGRSPETLAELPPGNHYFVHYPTRESGCDDFATVARKVKHGLQTPLLKDERFVISSHSAGGNLAAHLLSSEDSDIRDRTDGFIASAAPFKGTRWLVNQGLKFEKNPQADELRRGSPEAQKLREQWNTIFPEGTPFYMEQISIPWDWFVPKKSALDPTFTPHKSFQISVPFKEKFTKNRILDGLHRYPMGGLFDSYISGGKERGGKPGNKHWGECLSAALERFEIFKLREATQRAGSATQKWNNWEVPQRPDDLSSDIFFKDGGSNPPRARSVRNH